MWRADGKQILSMPDERRAWRPNELSREQLNWGSIVWRRLAGGGAGRSASAGQRRASQANGRLRSKKRPKNKRATTMRVGGNPSLACISVKREPTRARRPKAGQLCGRPKRAQDLGALKKRPFERAISRRHFCEPIYSRRSLLFSSSSSIIVFDLNPNELPPARQTDRQTDRQTGRLTDWLAGRRIGRFGPRERLAIGQSGANLIGQRHLFSNPRWALVSDSLARRPLVIVVFVFSPWRCCFCSRAINSPRPQLGGLKFGSRPLV